ncbi:unnamed protein product [Chrysodeixis includens]|uniref:Uncharacterized protein n=1 Tax=Chrysodeixis includens TaxID=689277 RepID=A0A9P0C5A8_CHRIL|nr:unnamed protein product [Chrysodeixis includens]
MVAYHIILCSLMVISTTATDDASVRLPTEVPLPLPQLVSQENWDKIVEASKELCKCSGKAIEFPTPVPDPNPCTAKETNIFFGLNSTSLLPLDNLCGIIRDLNKEILEAKKARSLITSRLNGENDTDVNGTRVNGTGSSVESYDIHGANITNTTKNENITVIINGSEIINSTGNENVTESTSASPQVSADANSTEEVNGTESATVGAIASGTANATENGNSTESEITPTSNSKLIATSVPATHGPPSEQKNEYSLTSILLTFFGAFGAGILIAVAAKIVYSKYRSRTYGMVNAYS